MKNIKIYGIDLLNSSKNEDVSHSSIMWGDFEFACFSNIDNFSQTCVKNNLNTVGVSNSRIYMYDIDSINSPIYFSEDDKSFRSQDGKEYNFIGITLLEIHNKISNIELYNKIILEMRMTVLKYFSDYLKKDLKENKTDTVFEVYGTLNSYDMCIVSLFDDIEKFIGFVEKIQEVEYKNSTGRTNKLFELSYSFVTSKYLKGNKNIFERSGGIANIQITYKCCSSFMGIVTKILNTLGIVDNNGNLKENYDNYFSVFSTIGEYDIVIQLPINLLNNSLYYITLNPVNNAFYEKHIKQCHTRFSKRMKYCPDIRYINYNSDSNSEEKNLNLLMEESNKLFKQLSETDVFKNNDAIKYMFEMLRGDFEKACSMTKYNSTWLIDLSYQYNAIIRYSKSVFDSSKKTGRDIFQYASSIINIFNQSIYHVKQKNTFSIEPIQCLFFNPVTYDKAINCYYYIVKCILLYLYQQPNHQSEIIPFINFDAVSLIKCSLYLESNKSAQILSISLPYDAFYNIEKYIPFLFHEIGHFVKPKNRTIRNVYGYYLITTLAFFEYYRLQYKNIDPLSLLNHIYHIVVNSINTTYVEFDRELFTNKWRDFFRKIKAIINDVLNLESFDDKFEKENLVYIQNKTDLLKSNIHNSILRKFSINECDIVKQENLKEKIWLDVEGELRGLREATADIFMITQTDLDLIQYIVLSIYIRTCYPLRTDDKTLLSEIRIGTIFEFYFRSTDKDERFQIDDEVKDRIISTCRNFMPRISPEIISHHLEEILESNRKYQQLWLPISDLTRMICDSVVLDPESGELEEYKKHLSLFRNQIKNIDFNSISAHYFDWINLSLGQYNFKHLQKVYKKFCFHSCSSKIKGETGYNLIKELFTSEEKTIISLPSYTIDSIGDFNQALLNIREVIGDANDTLWYRGQLSSEWTLTPALYRGKSYNSNIYDQLLYHYNEFVAQSAESMELIGTIRTEADWISYMQHYFIPTNFLDWTEQPLSALYFALENYFDCPCRFLKDDYVLKNCQTEDVGRSTKCYRDDAVVWVLNPAKMNRVLYPFDTSNRLPVPIPNLSISKNVTKQTKRFLLSSKDVTPIKKEDNKAFPPMAITTARISNRIRAQKGHFIAYDILNIKNISGKNAEELYKESTDIVTYHQKNISDMKDSFLSKIIIPFHLREKLSQYVKTMGISLSSIYPELCNIGKDINKKCLL